MLRSYNSLRYNDKYSREKISLPYFICHKLQLLDEQHSCYVNLSKFLCFFFLLLLKRQTFFFRVLHYKISISCGVCVLHEESGTVKYIPKSAEYFHFHFFAPCSPLAVWLFTCQIVYIRGRRIISPNMCGIYRVKSYL